MQNILSNKIKGLMDDSDVESLTPVAKSFIMEQLGEQIFQRILIQMTEDLPDEQIAAFLELVSNDTSNESVEIFMKAVYPDLEDVIEDKTAEVLEEYKRASRNTVTA